LLNGCQDQPPGCQTPFASRSRWHMVDHHGRRGELAWRTADPSARTGDAIAERFDGIRALSIEVTPSPRSQRQRAGRSPTIGPAGRVSANGGPHPSGKQHDQRAPDRSGPPTYAANCAGVLFKTATQRQDEPIDPACPP
jgi:hypothetical protein